MLFLRFPALDRVAGVHEIVAIKYNSKKITFAKLNLRREGPLSADLQSLIISFTEAT